MKEKLTTVQRQLLVNQFKILSKLHENSGYESEEYDKKAEILQMGYTSEYPNVFDVNFDEIPQDICDETNKILNMFRIIGNSIAALPENKRKELNLDELQFQGFDGNNDPHYDYAKFMIEKLGKWEEYKGDDLNSHSQIPLMRYKKMLKILDEVSIGYRTNLTFNDLQKLANVI